MNSPSSADQGFEIFFSANPLFIADLNWGPVPDDGPRVIESEGDGYEDKERSE